MTVAELQTIAMLVSELLEKIGQAEDKAKAWRLVAESLMGVVHKE